MATALPQIRSIKSGNSNKTGPTPPRSGTPKSRPGTGFSAKSLKLKNASRKEQEIILRREQLRNEQPLLNKAQTAAYRNTFKHNLCLDMLQAGYHRSFSELHMLMKRQSDAREAAGPDSALWNEPLLETETDKLESLKFYLTEAEEALRQNNLEAVYKNRFSLAQYFQDRGDKWLSDHFFQTCLEVSSQDKSGQQRLCEALCHVGLALEENGELFDAADSFEEYYNLSRDKSDWRTSTGKMYHTDACDHQTRIYTKISDSLDAEQRTARVEYLLKAYNSAKESGDESLAGEAAYKLGLAYIKMSDPKTALMYIRMYLESGESRNDDIAVGRACEAMAKAYDMIAELKEKTIGKTEGKTEESLKYLVRFVEVAERSKQDMALANACRNLGYIYNSRGNYTEASKYFSKAFSLAQAKNNRTATEMTGVHFGISNALGMMVGLRKHMITGNKQSISKIISWKNQRQDQFSSEDQGSSASAPPASEDQ